MTVYSYLKEIYSFLLKHSSIILLIILSIVGLAYLVRKYKIIKKNLSSQSAYEKDLKKNAFQVITIGIVFFCAALFLEYGEKYKLVELSPLWKTLEIIAGKIGEIALVFGIGTIAFEYVGFIKYARERLKEIVTEQSYLESLDINRRKKIKEDIDKSLYPKLAVLDEKSLYNVVHNSITPLLDSYYCKEFITEVNLTVEENLVKKEIYKEYWLAHLKEEEFKVGHLFSLRFNKKFYSDNSFEFLNATIDDKDLLEYIKNQTCKDQTEKCKTNEKEPTLYKSINEFIRIYSNTVDDDTEVVKVEFNLLDVNVKNDSVIKFKYKTQVPIDDCTYYTKITKPCQEYCIHVNYNNDQCNVINSSFCFMDIINNKRKDVRVSDNNVTIRFKDWSLPGEGTAFIILPKNGKGNQLS